MNSKSSNNENDIITELDNSALFDIAFELVDCCRKNYPGIFVNKNSVNDILDLLIEEVSIPNPSKNDSESSEDESEDYEYI